MWLSTACWPSNLAKPWAPDSMRDLVSKNKGRLIEEDIQNWSLASASLAQLHSHICGHVHGNSHENEHTYLHATHIHRQLPQSLNFSDAEWTWKEPMFTWRSHNQFYHVLCHFCTFLITRHLSFLSVLCHEVSTELLNVDVSWHLYWKPVGVQGACHCQVDFS